MSNKIDRTLPYGRQTINNDDVLAVSDALTQDFLTQGPTVGAFERALRETVGSKHATATSSAASSAYGIHCPRFIGRGYAMDVTRHLRVNSKLPIL